MPFKSQRQREWMYANKPEMARRWEEETKDKNLPERIRKKENRKNSLNKYGIFK